MTVLMTFLVTVTVMLGAVESASAQPAELDFVEPEKVVATFSGEKSDEVSVWLRNASGQELTPEFVTVLQDGDGAPAEAKVEVVGEGGKVVSPPPIGAGQVARYRLAFADPSESSGQLVATAPGVAAASVPLALGPELASTRGVDGALVVPLGAALILLALAWFYGHGGVKLTDKLGGAAELDFSKSFASTLTAVGALLGTIIAATGVLPEETVNLSKAGFTGLNLTFGIAIVISAAISSSVLKSEAKFNKDGQKEWKVEGFVLPFLIAALITLWAVFGELWTIWLLVEELGVEKGFSSLGVTVLQVLLVAGAVAMVPYTLVKIKVAVAMPEPPFPTAPVPAAPTPPPPTMVAPPAAPVPSAGPVPPPPATAEVPVPPPPVEAVPEAEPPPPPIQLL